MEDKHVIVTTTPASCGHDTRAMRNANLAPEGRRRVQIRNLSYKTTKADLEHVLAAYYVYDKNHAQHRAAC
jgi:hypothetical protein